MYGFIADIHLFANNTTPEDHINSLEMFLDIIKKDNEDCDGIFVCGDLFDCRGSKEELKFAASYILRMLRNGCKKDGCNAPVYFVHGTFSHDYEQYEIFLPILSQSNDVEIHYIKHVTEGKTHAGHNVLFLPQEYGNVDYTKYLNHGKHYNLIVGHGPISSVNKAPCKSKSGEITHSVDLLGDISDLCVFGHYHDYTDFGNNVYYIGANLRWKYGEDEPCVFFTCDSNFKVKTQLNPFAKEYKTIHISSPEELREHISQSEKDDHRRFIINAETTQELETYHAIINNNKNEKLLSFRITSNVDEKENDITKIDLNDIKRNNTGLDPVHSLISYIKDKYNADASIQIKEYEQKINKDIEDE